MDDVQAKIEQLKELQKKIRLWRFGGVVTILAVVFCCAWHVRQQSLALLNDGPAHDQFVAQFKNGLTEQAVPEVKKLTTQTLVRLGPAVRTEIAKIELRMPELSARAEEQMDLLRQHLPARAERALQPALGAALEHQLARWQKQYPTLTADQLSEASERLINEAHERMANVAAIVILPYEASWEQVIDDLAMIRKLEAGNGEMDPWELATASLGLVHEELGKLNPTPAPPYFASVNPKVIK